MKFVSNITLLLILICFQLLVTCSTLRSSSNSGKNIKSSLNPSTSNKIEGKAKKARISPNLTNKKKLNSYFPLTEQATTTTTTTSKPVTTTTTTSKPITITTTSKPTTTKQTTTTTTNRNRNGQIMLDYTRGTVKNCNTKSCGLINGNCISKTVCKCRSHYANVPGLNKDNKICNYQRKNYLVALKFAFIGFGAAHFYRGVWWTGVIQLLLTLFIPIYIVILCCCCPKSIVGRHYGMDLEDDPDNRAQEQPLEENETVSFMKGLLLIMIVPIIYVVVFIIWYIVDLILFGTGTYKDVNGVSMTGYAA